MLIPLIIILLLMKIVPPSATVKNAKQNSPMEVHDGWIESLKNEKRGMVE
jgi:hypothetical protein